MKLNLFKWTCRFVTIASLISTATLAEDTGANVATPFQQAVADYQQAVAGRSQSPNDAVIAEKLTSARDKVIKMAAAMDQLPAIPEEARKHEVRGTVLFKEAKTPEDYNQVLVELYEAVRLAPWWPEARYNHAIVCEAAGAYSTAIADLKLYQLFKLSDTEARTVQDKIYALEVKVEETDKKQAAERAVANEAAAKKQAEDSAKAQRQAWASSIVEWLNANYAGRVEEEYELHNFPKGQIKYQKDSGDWLIARASADSSSHNLLNLNIRILSSITGDDKDEIAIDAKGLKYIGVPAGSTVESVKWTYGGDKDYMKKLPQEAWFEFYNLSQDNDKPCIQMIRDWDKSTSCCTRWVLEGKK